ncbi:MAG TPA: flagellar M-ring protein FliF C-terminal domain-containing protein [Phycisphaerae bacterium]|jgi:flagellar biosynthesis/type III secretory pathway M-ring protein FliF/YscJ
METLRQILQRISSQLALLNTSQRLAIALCAVVVAGSLLWLIQWSATPELAALLDQDLTGQELTGAQAALDAARADYKVIGNRIWVRPSQRTELIGKLNSANALPHDISIGFDKLVADNSPFLPESQMKIRYNVALGNELAKVIRSSPDVHNAVVFISTEAKRAFSNKPIVPTASVHVMMNAGKEVNPAMAQSIAMLVSRAVPGMDAHNVSVIDALRSRAYSIPRPEDATALTQWDEVRRREDYQLGKIMEQLGYISGVLASVSIELDTTTSKVESVTYTKPDEKSSTSDATDSASGGTGSEPGVGANVGQALTANEPGEHNTSERTKTENFEPMPAEKKVVEKPPFSIRRATATVKIPRSYFVSVYRMQNGASSSPVDDELKPMMELEFNRVRNAVKKVVMSDADTDVDVSFFYDLDQRGAPLAAAATEAAAAATTLGGTTVNWLHDYGAQAGLAALATVSLLMMFMMARRTTRIVHPRAADEPEEIALTDSTSMAEEILTVGSGAVGQAEVSEAFLTGHEVDDETLRYKQLGEQVTKMVEQNPESAAELIRRWVERDR